MLYRVCWHLVLIWWLLREASCLHSMFLVLRVGRLNDCKPCKPQANIYKPASRLDGFLPECKRLLPFPEHTRLQLSGHRIRRFRFSAVKPPLKMRDHEIDWYSTVVPRFVSPSFPHLWHRPDAVQSRTLIILDILVMCVGLDYTGATRTTPVSSVFLRCVSRVSSCFSVGEILSVRSGDLRSNGAEMQALSALSRGTGSVVAMFAVFPAAGVVGQHVWHFFPSGINSFVDRSRHVNWLQYKKVDLLAR